MPVPSERIACLKLLRAIAFMRQSVEISLNDQTCMQRLSISGAAASVFGTPILVINTAESMPFAAQASICFTIASFGIFTTSMTPPSKS